ncbi:MAG: hypothetical protein K6F14_06935 [Clostridiales bacterium]|nr:hypothetical protein [Clostridiales bacterium]
MAERTEKKSKIILRSANEVKKFTVRQKIMRTAIAAMVILAVVIYLISVLYTKTGSFTVSINKFDATQYALTLSDTRDFYTPTAMLNAEISKEITNISESWLPADLDNIDGAHNGDNYVAYTFYLKNAGEGMVAYNYQMYIVNVENDLDEAIRIRLYIDGVWTNYARTATDGSGAEPGTTEFLTDRIVTQGQVRGFNPGDVTKYTVIIWIEGDDPDCIDDLLGGELKVAMDFEIAK